jgi:hypothetical protein
MQMHNHALAADRKKPRPLKSAGSMPMKNYLIYFTFVAALIIGCGKPEGTPVVPTKIDMLEFLVPNSDLIAIIQINDGVDKPESSMKRYSVIAEVKRVIIGDSTIKQVSIINASYFMDDNVVKDFITLYNGMHLSFLKKQDDSYKPVSGSAILRVAHNRVHPLWKQDGTKTGMTSGYDLDKIISEIMGTHRTSG